MASTCLRFSASVAGVEEGLDGRRSRRLQTDRRVDVHNEDRLAGISRLGESIEIGEVEAGVPAGKSEVGTGIMV
jgi:hypothetical protein